jgi:hypothetical protein
VRFTDLRIDFFLVPVTGQLMYSPSTFQTPF